MGKERRDSLEICVAVLKALDKPKTVNEVAAQVHAGWITVEKALRFLDSAGLAKRIVEKPLIYKRNTVLPLSDEFINELQEIIRREGSRHHSLEDCLDDALRDFIRKEKSILRY